MMNDSWWALVGMAFVLGMRHGFDLDHLATIDAIARNVRNKAVLSKMTGVLFSCGHGLVVTVISAVIGSGIVGAKIPEWLDPLGGWISILFLFLFGILNLFSLFQKPSSSTLYGLKSTIFRRFFYKKTANPAFIILIGALFALSFDTFSQAALFSLAASMTSGWTLAAVLGAVFTFGMMASDGLNGWLVSTVIQKADKFSKAVSNGLGIGITAFSLGIGSMNLIGRVFGG